ncbi:MAG: hypothetical protein ACK5MU_01840 [Candidatus Saccharimonadales bacterium]
MTDKFTIKNLFIYWIKTWPVIVILMVVGAGIGAVSASNLKQSYKSSTSILVAGTNESVMATDYAGIANSNLVVSQALEETGIPSGVCTSVAVNTGNILGITVECSASGDDSKALVLGVVDVFSREVADIYGLDEEASVVQLSGDVTAVAQLTQKDRITNIAVPVIAGFVISAVVAFVRFDYKTSKRSKK